MAEQLVTIASQYKKQEFCYAVLDKRDESAAAMNCISAAFLQVMLSLLPKAHTNQDSWLYFRLPPVAQNHCVALDQSLQQRKQPVATARERGAPPEQQIPPRWYGHHDI